MLSPKETFVEDVWVLVSVISKKKVVPNCLLLTKESSTEAWLYSQKTAGKLCIPPRLLKILLKEESLSSRVFRSLAVNDVESLVLVKQCRFLESAYGTNLTSTVLSSPEEISLSQLKNDIISMDHSLLLSECDSHPSGLSISPHLLTAVGRKCGTTLWREAILEHYALRLC